MLHVKMPVSVFVYQAVTSDAAVDMASAVNFAKTVSFLLIQIVYSIQLSNTYKD
jgi:hypothetical protein